MKQARFLLKIKSVLVSLVIPGQYKKLFFPVLSASLYIL